MVNMVELFFGLKPVLAELIVAVVVTFLSTIPYRFLTDQAKVREIKEKQKELQKKVKEVPKENTEEAGKLSKEVLELTNKQMMMNMKPMFVTLGLVILILPWMSGAFVGQIALLPFSLPFFGNDFGWLAWYFFISLPFTTLFRKLLGVE